MTDLVKLSIAPDKASYVVTDGTQVDMQQLEGGSGAYRADILNSSSQVSVQWSVDGLGYEYLRAFYRTITQHGALPFTIDLILDKPFLTTHTAHFVPGTSLGPAQIQGETYTVSATLEVEPLDADEDYDNSIVTMFNIYGDATGDILNLFDVIVNHNWPAA